MPIRLRGVLILLASISGWLVLYWLLFKVLGGTGGNVRVPAYPLALPLIGMVIGVVELATGLPFSQAADAWQRLPRWLQVPLGCLIGIVLVVGIVAGFYYALTRL